MRNKISLIAVLITISGVKVFADTNPFEKFIGIYTIQTSQCDQSNATFNLRRNVTEIEIKYDERQHLTFAEHSPGSWSFLLESNPYDTTRQVLGSDAFASLINDLGNYSTSFTLAKTSKGYEMAFKEKDVYEAHDYGTYEIYTSECDYILLKK